MGQDGQSVRVGDVAPDFALPAQSGTEVRLSDFRDRKVVVLYFFPKDNTPGCTAEACAFRDSHEVFVDAGAEVLGVSSDSVAAHQKFGARHQLPFTLLSDRGGVVRKRYGVARALGVLPGRVTYVIDRTGVVRHMFCSLTNIDRHVADAVRIVTELRADQPDV